MPTQIPSAPDAPPTTDLDMADLLAQGKAYGVMLGQRRSYALRGERAWTAYEAAKRDGYLVTTGNDRTHWALRNIWCAYTVARGLPFVVVEPRRTWAAVQIDMILLPPRPDDPRSSNWRLSEGSIARIDALLGEVTHRSSYWTTGATFCYSPAVPLAVAPHIARQFVTIAAEDIEGGAQ